MFRIRHRSVRLRRRSAFFLTPESWPLNPGFTLVEMAVVLVIIGLVILTIFPALTATRASSQRALTQSNLQALLLATAAYVQANGCVPCPTAAASTGNAFGVVPNYSTSTPCGVCAAANAEGIPPFMSLGLPASTAHDGWGHWITMRIDPELSLPPLPAGSLATTPPVVPPTKPQACSCTFNGGLCNPSITGCTCAAPAAGFCAQPFNFSNQGLCTANVSNASVYPNALPIQIITPDGDSTNKGQRAAVIFVSHGSKGYGAFIANAMNDGTNGKRLQFSANQQICDLNSPLTTAAFCNASNTAQFIATPMSNSYDDMMVFADRNTLVSMLGSGSCQTVW